MKPRMIIIALLAAGVLAAAGAGLYRLGASHAMQAGPAIDAIQAEPAAGAGDKKVLYWHDPMVPAQKFDKPGKSPFMDMQLVPVYADGADSGAHEGGVSINPQVQQNLGIRTAPVTKGHLTAPFDVAGNIAYNERDVAQLQARSNGFVEKLYVRAPLDAVRQGQPLLDLYVPEWVAAQEEYLSVRHMAGPGSEGLLDGARQRMRLVGMTEQQIGQVEHSGKTQPRLTITAPLGGVVTELGARIGMTVAPGMSLFRINGLGTVWVNAEVPESMAGQVRPGNTVEARLPALPDTVFKGTVGAILPGVNTTTRTLIARIELLNPGAKLTPGMFATIKLNPSARGAQGEVLLVPSEAVIQTGTRSVVMLAVGGGKFAPAEVVVGQEAGGQSEIRKGLQEGQQVVVSGQFLIDSEASLKGTLTRIGDPAAAASGAGAMNMPMSMPEKEAP
ncbi:efflux RND transporter periplasmic adaptor subunit [Janthinobacterium agaricidamnosum]|uniref:Cation efflux system protein CusB n=1 Tax=Janthinobacterium agaricidamnosum NBRC 102515 = DSM 9628 TaxID=1349767 RepID=W0V6W9_9BURK|nr:efflux RND transporter periplasmic adaptor subunit [Janthinobacterium agaricidamnosum]CDG83093.1 cation efflux system protein CusB [Janthinobacterium agaricidamnosum NBRC 102515 = DSM 9628]